MSKTLRYDSLLVRALATALADRFGGARIRAIRFLADDRILRLSFPRRALVWDLDPNGGGLWQEPERGTPGGLVLPRATFVVAVRAAPDDRVLEWLLRSERENDATESHLWIELLPNRRNAVLTAADGRLLGSLSPVSNEPGTAWAPPEPRPRRGWDGPPGVAAFVEMLRECPPADRERRLQSTFAFTSPLNAAAILGDAATSTDTDALDAAAHRYLELLTAHEPGILEPGLADQPYPAPLPGREFRKTADLLVAFDEVAPVHRTRAEGRDPADVIAELVRLRETEESKIDRLRAELAGAAAEAKRLRADADLLLGQLHLVRRGMQEATLNDWKGGTVSISLDPALDPAANANRMYEKARKRERAAERLPGMIEKAVRRCRRLADAERTVSADPTAVDQAIALIPERPASRTKTRHAPRLPYRRYRTSGGLEVRVGRGSRSNDELTLHHSSPEDVWLHARDVAGAHVVLRWGRREGNPPARDLAEAAVLAALHSRARTSGTVPVDWTRRKYVRKPRKAPPGRVTLERAQTIFVEPDAKLEERLRED